MPTKLSRYLDGVMEAAWLAAVILVPMFFNVFSSRIFEPDKIALLRSLALLLCGAWVVKVIEEGGIRWEKLQPGEKKLSYLLRVPMVAPALATAIIYLVATLFSVTPRVSFLGSYQRLQGTYSWLSYLVIFAVMLGNVRRREQVERFITTIVLVSIPISLYGILQRYEIDPIPWGGDTVIRIASNMGNSIFVAAYLIMVFPLTVGRIVHSFGAILGDSSRQGLEVARATVYVFAAAVQVIALYMSGSRGPALGWMAGTFFMALLLSLYWQKRKLTLGILGFALLLGAGLLVFNLEGGPLESLRQSPAIGRFSNLLNAESNSALVRKYIWQGAAELVAPHEPISFPDGSVDRFNFLRPLIGYGPESMYVAYNPFYVPELALVERRNASPDRSHNESWDALVTSGVLGLVIYLALFTLVFYYALKWIGLVIDRQQSTIFLGLVLGGGLTGAVALALWREVAYFGVGLPFGMLMGLLGYISLAAIQGRFTAPETPAEKERILVLVVLVAAIVAHFVEINFGIAIAATRTYFWAYTALLVVAGYILPRYGDYDQLPVVAPASKQVDKGSGRGSRKKRRTSRRNMDGLVAYSGLMVPVASLSLIMMTMGFDYLNNPTALKTSLAILWNAFTRLPNRGNVTSYGVLMLLLFTWALIGIALAAEWARRQEGISFGRSAGTILGISAIIILVFWIWHAANLAAMARQAADELAEVMEQVQRYENLLSTFYLVVAGVIFWQAYYLGSDQDARLRQSSGVGILASVVVLIVVSALAVVTNLRVIQADISFKLAEPFTRSGQWPVAITIYDRANTLAPNEDYYYLFLGRAYIEHAKTLSDVSDRDQLIRAAEDDLKIAQKINPLNTDHTANLARLYSLWASVAGDPEEREQRGMQSAQYFEAALRLSPNSARIWDEWAILYLDVLRQPESALARLNSAIEIDPRYHWTYALLGEYYTRQAGETEDETQKRALLDQAVENFLHAIELPTPGEPRAHYNYALALGASYAQMGDYSGAIQAYQQALEMAPAGTADTWRVEEVIAGLYMQMGDPVNTALHLRLAYESAPEDQRERLASLLSQVGVEQP